MRDIFHLNYGWEYSEIFTREFAGEEKTDVLSVDLPHTCAITPYDYFDEGIYQKDCGYRKSIRIPESAAGRRVFLIIGAAAHSAQVYVNGIPCGERHKCGYTSFTRELTEFVEAGSAALLSIEVDSRENQDIPPFGNVIDYMTYGGIYREVRLEIRDECHISDIFAMPEKTGRLTVQCQAEGSPDSVRHTVYLNGGKVCEASSESVETCPLNVPDVILWDTENPALYTLVSELIRNGEITDRVETRIGFREADYKVKLVPNVILKEPLGVYDIRVDEGEGEIPFDTEKGIIVGNIRMGFGHYRISIAIASAANALGYTPYWMDLNSYPTTTCTKVISAQNDLYSMGSRLSQKSRLFNKKILGAAQLRRLPTADLQFWRPEERGAYGAGI
jgi:hypothetical protein